MVQAKESISIVYLGIREISKHWIYYYTILFHFQWWLDSLFFYLFHPIGVVYVSRRSLEHREEILGFFLLILSLGLQDLANPSLVLSSTARECWLFTSTFLCFCNSLFRKEDSMLFFLNFVLVPFLCMQTLL